MSASLRIGIAGPSCSGKTTLARGLARKLGWDEKKIFHLDGPESFYLPNHEPRHVQQGSRTYRSYEHPEAYDGHALGDALTTAGGGIADGFLIFSYGIPFDLKFFIDVPWEEQKRRRFGRLEQSPPEVNESFLAIGEEEWERYGASQKDQAGVIVLDGMLPQETLLEQAHRIVLE